jgi:hypothetical protein
MLAAKDCEIVVVPWSLTIDNNNTQCPKKRNQRKAAKLASHTVLIPVREVMVLDIRFKSGIYPRYGDYV